MYLIQVIIAILLLMNSLTVSAQGLTTELDKIITQRLPNADVGVVVADANTGQVLYEHQGFKAFTPASTLKLFAVTAALYGLGSNFRFQTTAAINKKQLQKGVLHSDLVVTFTGDPSFTTHQLDQLFHDVRRYGIREISGNIIIDDTQFSPPNYGPGWSVDDIAWYYAAPVTSVIVDENANQYKLIPGQSLDEKTQLIPKTTPSLIHTVADINTVTDKQAKERCSLVLRIERDNTINASGCWPIGETAKTERIALANPNQYAIQLIHRSLRNNKIAFHGKIVVGKRDDGLTVIAKKRSKPLKQLIKPILKDSNDLYADSLTKTLGAVYYQQGDFNNGVLAIRAMLTKHAGINFDQVRLADGSGLSRYDLITPRAMMRLLYVVQHTPKLRKLIKTALPRYGKEGTLAKRMRTFDVDSIKAKTGSMSGVATLTGYITAKDDRELVFVIMINRIVGPLTNAIAAQEEIVSRLYTVT